MRSYLSLFYMLNSYITYELGSFFVNASHPAPQYAMFAQPLGLIGHHGIVYPVFFYLCMALSVLCIFRPTLYLRIASCFSQLILISMFMSFGKVDQHYNIWLLAHIFFCFADTDQGLSTRTNFFLIRLTQSFLLVHYFIAGLWKLTSFNLNDLGRYGVEHMAYAIAEGRGPNTSLQALLLPDFTWLVELGYWSIVAFQCLCLTPVLTNRYFKTWGALSIAFHCTTGMAQGIWFVPTALAVLFFLIYSELLLDRERG